MRQLLVLVLTGAVTATVASGAPLRKPPRGHGMQVRVGAYTIQPSEDLEVCEYRRLPNKKPMDVTRFTLRMPPGAHHFAVWGYGGSQTDDAAFAHGPVESIGCTGAAKDD